jgi:hypothetical protein
MPEHPDRPQVEEVDLFQYPPALEKIHISSVFLNRGDAQAPCKIPFSVPASPRSIRV